MNYTYLPTTPFSSQPIIVMTTNPASKKTHNLVANPRVSLLVHDWVSHRPPVQNPEQESRLNPEAPRSSLANLLRGMNTSALSRISATINGEARIAVTGSEEERWCKKMHLENNTFGEQATPSAVPSEDPFGSPEAFAGDGGRECFIEGEAVQVVIVKINDGRIADWKGSVQDWVLSSADGPQLVNGVN